MRQCEKQMARWKNIDHVRILGQQFACIEKRNYILIEKKNGYYDFLPENEKTTQNEIEVLRFDRFLINP